EEAIQRTLAAQTDSARIEDVRKQHGEAAAAAEEARLAFQRQNPMAVHQTVEALGAALGQTQEQIVAEREVLQLLIDQADAAENVDVRNAERLAVARQLAEQKREEAAAIDKALQEQKAAVDEQRRLQEDAVRDVADLYENLFNGNTDKIWGN